MSEANAAMETAAAAVTGEGSPDNASVHRPASGAVIALFVALGVACGFGLLGTLALWIGEWPESVAALRVHFLGWATMLSIGCIPVVVLAFATPWIGRISATAGSNSLSVEAR